MSNIKEYTNKTFEDIKHTGENGEEFWYARELMSALEYKKWQKFNYVIENAKIACENSGSALKTILPKWVKWSILVLRLKEK